MRDIAILPMTFVNVEGLSFHILEKSAFVIEIYND